MICITVAQNVTYYYFSAQEIRQFIRILRALLLMSLEKMEFIYIYIQGGPEYDFEHYALHYDILSWF
jgi:hypothetical protein